MQHWGELNCKRPYANFYFFIPCNFLCQGTCVSSSDFDFVFVGEMVQPDLNRFKPDLPLFLLQKWFWIFISNNKKKNLKSFHWNLSIKFFFILLAFPTVHNDSYFINTMLSSILPVLFTIMFIYRLLFGVAQKLSV